MSKKKSWVCGDCDAKLPGSTKWCDAPQHDATVRALIAERQTAALESLIAEREVAHSAWSTTIDEFFEEYTEALYAYIKSIESRGDRHHPLDLAYTASAFNDVWVIISEVKEGQRLDRKKNLDT